MLPIIQEELKNGVMTLSLNRPEKLNALTLEMMDTLLKNLTRAEEDSEVRCIILRGNGEFLRWKRSQGAFRAK